MSRRVIVSVLGLALAAWPAFSQAPAKKSDTRDRPAKKSAVVPGEKSGLNKQHLESYLRHLFLWAPQIKVAIDDFTPSPVPGLLQTTVRPSFGALSDQIVLYVSADGKYILNGSLLTAADNPFRSEISKITTDMQPSFGAPGASVVLVVFSDYQCPHCREEAKTLRENIPKAYPQQVRVYFKDLPLPNHDWARTAAIAGRCIFRQNPLTFWDFHDWVFEKQSEITAANFREKLNGFIQGKEIDPLQLNRCVDQRETEAEINKSLEEARSLRINSTPTVFLNGRRLGNTPWPNLKQIIDYELEYQKTAKNAGEQECCQVRLPGPLSQP